MSRGRFVGRVMVLAVVVGVVVSLAVFVERSRPEESIVVLDTGFTSVEQRTLSTTETFSGTIRFAGALTVTHGGAGGGAPNTAATTAADSVPEIVTWVSPAGTVISSGTVLYEVNGLPIVVLEGAIPAYRRLERGVEGADVAQLQEALVAAGHDPDGSIDIDGEFGALTEALVENWQAAIGLEVDGSVDLGEVIFQPGTSRVSAVSVGPGDEITTGQAILELTSAQRVVELDVEADRARLLAGGAPVDIRLPDRTVVPGTVVSVGSVVDAETSTVPVLVTSDELSDASDQAPATVLVERTIAGDAFVVETEAVMSTISDGYVVELIADDGSTARLPVEVGSTDGIVVVIEGDGLEAGLLVVAPA